MLRCLFLQGVPWAGISWLETSIFYLLILIAIVIGVTMFMRYRKVKRIISSTRQYAPKVALELKNLDFDGAIKLSESFERESHLASIILSGLKQYKKIMELPHKEKNFPHIKNAMERNTNTLQFEYEWGLGFWDAIGRTSPFIGALGGSPLTFAIGILIAIPVIWFASYQRTMTNRFVMETKNLTTELLEYIENQTKKGISNKEVI